MRAGPPAGNVILDEATASVDPFTEWQIQQALGLILQNTTNILTPTGSQRSRRRGPDPCVGSWQDYRRQP
jgi:hypothetical protein